MPTFGKTDIGGNDYACSTGRIRGSRFTLSEAATVTKISACLFASSGTVSAKVGIYDVDGSNDPNNLVAVSDEVNGIDTTPNTWYDFTISAELSAGEYYLTMESSGDVEWYGDAVGERHWSATRTYGDAWFDPFQSNGSSALEYSIYATYTAAGVTYTKTWATDALFKKLGIQKSLNVDTAFQKQDNPKTFSLDAAFQKSFTIQKQIGALFKRLDIPKSFVVDACFGALVTHTIARQIDVVLKKLGAAKIFGLDVYFGAVEAETYAKSFGLSVMFAYKVRLPELWLDENGKIVLNISKPYTWVGS